MPVAYKTVQRTNSPCQKTFLGIDFIYSSAALLGLENVGGTQQRVETNLEMGECSALLNEL